MANSYYNPYFEYPTYRPSTSGMYGYTMSPSTTPIQPQGLMMSWVNNVDEARNAYVNPGMTAHFMDKNLPVVYAKTVDSSGKTVAFTIYDLVERVDSAAPVVKDEYVKVSDIEALVEKKMQDAGWKIRTKKEE